MSSPTRASLFNQPRHVQMSVFGDVQLCTCYGDKCNGASSAPSSTYLAGHKLKVWGGVLLAWILWLASTHINSAWEIASTSDRKYLFGGINHYLQSSATGIALDGGSLVENSQIDMLGDILSDCIDKIKSLCTSGTCISELGDSTNSSTYSDESDCEKMALEFYLSAEVFSNVLLSWSHIWLKASMGE
uniref:Uncharacterized protein n=1 Tax=Ditylenchus dipsaci TaxID=166011 RepID=A0A915DRM4_9BILA